MVKLRYDTRAQIGGMEWIIILLGVVLLLFGSKKIPEFARSLGRATQEFQRGKLEVESEIKQAFKEKEDSQPAGKKRKKVVPPPHSMDAKVIRTAEALGIETAGKTTEELKREIEANLSPAKETPPENVVAAVSPPEKPVMPVPAPDTSAAGSEKGERGL